MCVALSNPESPEGILFRSSKTLRKGVWSHIALTVTNSTPSQAVIHINGEPSESFAMVLDTDITLDRIGSREDAPDDGFCGLIDEVRVWQHVLDANTITANRSIRMTGLENLLFACWHFDEGEGDIIHDATENECHVSLVLIESDEPAVDGWTTSDAPVRRSAGLSRQTLRIQSDVEITGGIGAAVYYEQVTISPSGASTSSATFSTEGSTKSEEKPMKRNARLLLSAIASRRNGSFHSPLALDFGLLSDGTLSDTPGTLSVPSLTLSGNIGSSKKVIPSLLFIDPQGVELFGGLLSLDETKASTDAPCVWEAATGSVTIYYKNDTGQFSALPYNISRYIPVENSTTLSDQETLLASCKLRVAKQLTISSDSPEWIDSNLAVDLNIVVETHENKQIVETWKGKMCRDHEREYQLTKSFDDRRTKSHSHYLQYH